MIGFLNNSFLRNQVLELLLERCLVRLTEKE